MQPTRGPAIEASDPSENVKELSEAGHKRQDDLRLAERAYFEAKIAALREIIVAQARYQEQLDAKESARLDAIRQVDREEVNKTAAQSLTAIQTLAATTTTTAETLRTQVATTAQATAGQLATISAEINKRLSALELSSSERTGKQGVSDPALEKLTERLESLLVSRSEATGKTAGVNWVGVVAVGAVTMIVGLLTIAGVLYAVLSK